MRVLILLLLVPLAWASTVTTNLILGKTETTGTSFTALARPTPYIVLTSAGTIDIYGIASSGAVDGEIVVVIRTGVDTTNVYHNSASAATNDKIILPRGGSTFTRTGRIGLEFAYRGGFWFFVGDT